MAKKQEITATELANVETVQAVVYTPEQRELALQKKIKADAKRLPVVDAKITKLKAQYSGLTIHGIDDKKGYAAVKKAISELVSYRTSTDNKKEEITKDYRDVIKGVNAEAARIVELIRDIETPLRDLKKKYEEDLEAEKKRIEEAEKKRIEDRVNELKSAGLSFDGSFYVLGNISIDLGTIKKMPDDKFILLKSKAADESVRLAEEEAERERIREAERVKIEKEKQEAEAERLRLEKEREDLKRQREEQQAEIDKLKKEAEDAKLEAERLKKESQAEIDRLQKESQEKAEKLEREKIEAKAALVGFHLEGIGLRRVGDHYTYHDNVINAGVTYDIKDALNFNSNDDVLALVETLKLSLKTVNDKRKEHDDIIDKRRKEEQEARDKEAKRLADEAEAIRKAALPDVEKINLFFENVTLEVSKIDVNSIANEQMKKQLTVTVGKLFESLADLKKSIEIFTK